MRGRSIAGFVLAGVLATAGVVAVTLSSAWPGETPATALVYGLMVALPVGVGLYAWRREPDNRFGPLLMVAGFIWPLSALTETHVAVLFSLGHVVGWPVGTIVIFLVLSFPTGRIEDRVERALLAAVVAIVALLYMPMALLAAHYPNPAPWSPCGDACPANAFLVTGHELGFVDSVLSPLRDALSVLTLLAAGAVLARRIRRSSAVMRRTLAPVVAAAIVFVLSLGVVLYLDAADPTSALLDPARWVMLASIPGIALGFLVGILRSRLFAAEALERLMPRLRATGDPAGSLAEVLDDATLELAYRLPGAPERWVDAEGRSVELPQSGDRCVTEIRDGQRTVAAVIHDPALADAEPLVRGAASAALVALENQRLAAELRSSLRDLRESRARVVAAADDERRRIERDLHDGAQQHLVSLRVRLKLAEERAAGNGMGGLLHELGGEIEEALDEIRSLARGIYPALLADQGLGEALRSAALRAPLPVGLDVDGAGRYAAELENAVYFTCLEALQNAVKHTHASRVAISIVDEGDELRFEVGDDGKGFDLRSVETSAGLRNMRDRIAAIGGRLTIRSEPGEGTLVAGSIPLRRNDDRLLHAPMAEAELHRS